MFYEFRQNNSGGCWDGPAISVIVEADNADEANQIAETKGLYFNGVDAGSDCECCGDRWYPQWREDGDKVPSHYGKPIGPMDETYRRWAEQDKIHETVVFYKDGTEKVI